MGTPRGRLGRNDALATRIDYLATRPPTHTTPCAAMRPFSDRLPGRSLVTRSAADRTTKPGASSPLSRSPHVPTGTTALRGAARTARQGSVFLLDAPTGMSAGNTLRAPCDQTPLLAPATKACETPAIGRVLRFFSFHAGVAVSACTRCRVFTRAWTVTMRDRLVRAHCGRGGHVTRCRPGGLGRLRPSACESRPSPRPGTSRRRCLPRPRRRSLPPNPAPARIPRRSRRAEKRRAEPVRARAYLGHIEHQTREDDDADPPGSTDDYEARRGLGKRRRLNSQARLARLATFGGPVANARPRHGPLRRAAPGSHLDGATPGPRCKAHSPLHSAARPGETLRTEARFADRGRSDRLHDVLMVTPLDPRASGSPRTPRLHPCSVVLSTSFPQAPDPTIPLWRSSKCSPAPQCPLPQCPPTSSASRRQTVVSPLTPITSAFPMYAPLARTHAPC